MTTGKLDRTTIRPTGASMRKDMVMIVMITHLATAIEKLTQAQSVELEPRAAEHEYLPHEP